VTIEAMTKPAAAPALSPAYGLSERRRAWAPIAMSAMNSST